MKRVGKGGHRPALRILNRRRMYNFGPDTILPDSSTVIIQKYFLHNLLLHKLSQSSQSQYIYIYCFVYWCDTAQIEVEKA